MRSAVFVNGSLFLSLCGSSEGTDQNREMINPLKLIWNGLNKTRMKVARKILNALVPSIEGKELEQKIKDYPNQSQEK